LRIPPGHSHSYGFILAHLTRPVGRGKAVALPLLALPGTVDVAQPSWPGLRVPARAPGPVAEPRVFLMAGCRITPVLVFWILRELHWVKFTF
jgi:hypothetical protein